jgi:predicted metalloenzyme YecM
MSQTDLHDKLGDYDAFVANINRGLETAGINRDELALLDHLGYRTETTEQYEAVLADFRSLGADMGAIVVEGRPISVIALDEPINTGGWIIPFIEILAPKASSPYPSGLEHAEFVTVRRLKDFEAQHTNLGFIRDAMNRPINPELKYRENGISVKFHRLSIGTVVEIDDEKSE